MTRQLRPRKGKPSYAALFANDEDEDEPRAGPSSISRTFVEDEIDSESDFEPERKENGAADNPVQEDDEDEDEDAMGEIDEEEDVVEVVKPRALKRKRKSSPEPVITKPKGKLKVKTDVSAKVIVGPKGTKRQNYVLPAPSVNHRHRAVPLYSREGRVERLTAPPTLFTRPATTLTNGFTENSKVTDRVNKAWGYNVGSGPLWELAEDRAWYKEALTTGDDVDIELMRRPRVYGDVALPNDWEILNSEDAALYMPTDDVTTEEGNLKPPPPTVCYLGPINRQSRETLSMMGSIPMALPVKHMYSMLGPPFGVLTGVQYMSTTAPQGNTPNILQSPRSLPTPTPRTSVGSTPKSTSTRKTPSQTPDRGHMKCKMVLCLDSGPAYDLKWCPLPSHDPRTDGKPHKKLGILGGTFEDGSFSVFVIPDPADMAPDSSQPIYVKLSRPILRIELEETACWTFDWANSEVIAIGTTNGTIAVYNIGLALKMAGEFNHPTITDLVPTHYLSVHQSAIRALAWIKSPPCWPSGVPRVDQDPTAIASAGYDGMECLTDIRDGRGSVMNRTRDVINALVFSAFAGGPITMDHENTVKAYSASPSMLGRGHSLFEPQGPVWTVHASDFHPQLVAGAADGSCSTTNILRSTRRGGSVPFFVHKIFQMDYNRNTKEYRMLDQFLPQETYDRTTATRIVKGKVKKRADIVIPTGTGAWPREVGVHRVVWNNGNGLGAAALMAAGTASGLCRVDVLWGRWLKDKIPYGGVAGVRMEDGDAMEVDSELSGEDSEGA